MAHSTARKPNWRRSWGLHPQYPLFPLPATTEPGKPDHRRWAKKVRRKLHYFGKVAEDPKGEAALVEWNRVKDALIAGDERPEKDAPPAADEGITVGELCDRFLQAKELQRDAGELSPLTWCDYESVCIAIVKHFGKTRAVESLTPADFEQLRASYSKGRGLVSIGNWIIRTRTVFKYGSDAALIDHPVKFGPLFRKPGKKKMREHKEKQNAIHGKKLFAAQDIKRLLATATPTMRAMIMLGINSAFGPSDLATLPLRALDLDAGWIDHARPKTGVARRVPLWRETVEALRAAIANRRQRKNEEHARLVFITAALGSFAKSTTDSPITKEFAKMVKKLGLKQKGRGFYSLRHTFRTIARKAKDPEAARAIMGHESGHVEEDYMEEAVEDKRLVAVSNFVRGWLYPLVKPTTTIERPATLRVVG